MNKDLKSFIEKQKATYCSMIEQEEEKREHHIKGVQACEVALREYNKLLTQLERDELIYGDNSKQ